MERLSHGESIDHYQTVRVRKDGRRIDVSVTVSPVRDSEGRVIGASAIARDITAQQETIREALQIRDEFISIAAHELRTPMSTVYARLQLAERRLGRPDGDREAILRDVKLAMEAAERMRKLVDRLLDISRLSSGRLELERAPTDVAATVRTVAGMFEELSARKIRVHVPRHADGARANVDALRVEQVVANLLDNASKYSPQEAPIEVDVTENRHAVCIAVRDHGDGVPEDQHEQIFEPFHRATNDKPGVGLGLHVAREIVRLHGGSLVLETPADGGARFVITLPKDGKPE
jgi:signal transduction histidine kinase